MIIVVEDHGAFAEALKAFLNHLGYGVECCSTAEDALAIIAATKVDLVITKVELRGMGGMALLRTLNRNFNDLPVILLTRVLIDADEAEARQLGAFDYLLKHRVNWPYFPTIVRHAIGVAAERRLRREFI